MMGDSCCHHSDSSAAGDQNILTDHIVGQSSMHGISQRIERRNHIFRNRIGDGDRHYVVLRDHQILSKGAVSVHAHAFGIAA